VLPLADLFVQAPAQREERNNPAKTGYGIESSEEARTSNLEMHKTRVCKECHQVIDKIIDKDLIDKINNSKGDNKKLALVLGNIIQQIKSGSSLNKDQNGFEGNELRIYINNFKAPQFNCDYESAIVIDSLKYLQQKLKEKGITTLNDFEFDSVSLDYHTGAGIFKKGTDKKEALIILDTWISEKGEGPKIFVADDKETAKKQWEKAVQEFTKKESDESFEFMNAFKYKSEENIKIVFDFHKNWINKRGGKLHWLYGTEPSTLDYFFLKYYASQSSELREAIPNDYFELMRDKIIYFLEKEEKLTKDEKEQLASFSLLNKSAEEQKGIWKALSPFISRYFETMYPGNKTVKKILIRS